MYGYVNTYMYLCVHTCLHFYSVIYIYREFVYIYIRNIHMAIVFEAKARVHLSSAQASPSILPSSMATRPALRMDTGFREHIPSSVQSLFLDLPRARAGKIQQIAPLILESDTAMVWIIDL